MLALQGVMLLGAQDVLPQLQLRGVLLVPRDVLSSNRVEALLHHLVRLVARGRCLDAIPAITVLSTFLRSGLGN